MQLPDTDFFPIVVYVDRMADKPFVPDVVFRTAGWISPVVLYDGAVAGVWERKNRVLRVELFVRETKRLRAGIDREVRRLGEFLGLPVDVRL